MASTSYVRSWQDLVLINFALLVLFLFSATFYPLDIYPDAVALVAQLSPLYHGVTLIRSLTLGSFEPTLVWHIVFLVVMGAAGLAVTRRRLAALLTP